MNPRTTIALLAACLGFAVVDCRAETVIGVHVGSIHAPDRGQNNSNPGLYIREAQVQAGVYRNSYKRTTLYAGFVQPVGPIDLMLGFASGYEKVCSTYQTKQEVRQSCTGFSKHKITPMGALSYAPKFEVLGVRPRIWFLPGFGRVSSVAHISFEKEFH